MNIWRITNQSSRLLLMLLVLFALSCTNEKRSNDFGVSNNMGIDFRVVPQLIDSNDVELNFHFVSTKPKSILMNWTSLSIFDPKFERDSLLKRLTAVNQVLDSLLHPQFMVENEAGDRRFFSDITLFEGETLEMESVFSFEDKVDTIRMVPNKDVTVKSERIGVNRLRVKQSDNKIRLYYLFKPTEAEKAAGYEKLCLVSNWFQLK